MDSAKSPRQQEKQLELALRIKRTPKRAYETFEDTWHFFGERNPLKAILLLVEEKEAIDQFEAARLHQARVLDELQSSRGSLDSAFMEFQQQPSSSRCSVGRPKGREPAGCRTKEKG